MQQVLPATKHLTYWLLVAVLSAAFSRDAMKLQSISLDQNWIGTGFVKANISRDVKHRCVQEDE
jgi:hypothetical protein